MNEPLIISAAVQVPPGDLSWTAARSSGPGGQNVNKVASKVELRFDLPGTRALDETTKARLRTLAGARLDAGRGFGLLEAGKTVFPVKTPFAARLVDANPALDPSARAINLHPFESWLVELEATAPLPAGVLLPWSAAAPQIERIMERYAFRDLADFATPLFHEDNRDF